MLPSFTVLTIWNTGRRSGGFHPPSFARSFELHEGIFYLGLGTTTNRLSEASGGIYQFIPSR